MSNFCYLLYNQLACYFPTDPVSAELTDISTVFVSVGHNATLPVANAITGNPVPLVSWTFYDGPNSSLIEITGKYESNTNGGQLTIHSVGIEDIGDYNVTISNGIGKDVTAVISLKELGKLVDCKFSMSTHLESPWHSPWDFPWHKIT